MSNPNPATLLLDLYFETNAQLQITFASCTANFLTDAHCKKITTTPIYQLIEASQQQEFKKFAKASQTHNQNFTFQFNKKIQSFLVKKINHPSIAKHKCFICTTIPTQNTRNNIGNLVKDVNAIMFAVDAKGLITACSNEVEKFLHIKRSKIINVLSLHQLSFTEPATVKKNFEKAYTSNEKFEMEASILIGKKLHVVNWKFSTPSHTNNHHYKIVIGKDITNIVNNRATLQESEERFRTLAETLPLPVGCVSKKGELIFLNEAANKLFGLNTKTAPTLEDYYANFYFTNEEAVLAKQRFIKDISTNKNTIPTRLGKLKSNITGETVTVEVNAAITKDYIYYYYNDITDKLKYERDLISARDYFKKIAQNLPKPVAICDKKFDVIFLNTEFENVFGYSIKDLPTLAIAYELVIADSQEEREIQKAKWKEYVSLFIEDKLSTNILIERKIICKDSSVKYFEIAISAQDGLMYSIFNDVTQKKLQEESLQESEQKFRNITENIKTPVTCTTLDFKFLYVNKGFTEIFGLDIDNVNNDYFKRLVFNHPTEQEEITTAFLKLVNRKLQGEDIDLPIYTLKIIDKNNTLKTFELSVSLHESLLYFIYVDITDRIAAEKKLKASEQRFRNISDNAPLSICTFDLNMNITYINKRFHNLVGYNLKEVSSGQTWPHFIQYNTYEEELRGRDEWLKAINDALKGKRKKTSSLERTITCKDGTKRIFDISFTVEDKLVYAILDDVTDRKKYLSLLYESEQRFKALAEKMPIAIASHNLNEQVNFINNYFTSTIGYTIEEIPTLLDWYKKTQPNAELRNNLYHHWLFTIEEFRKNPSSKIPYIETQLKCKDGNYRTFNFLFSIHEADVFVILVDITQRRKAELELIQSHVQLRELASHLQKVREEERKYISREIHDELGQLVTGLKMDISMCKKTITKELPAMLPKLDGILDLTDTIVRTVRRISSELRPGIIDDLGLIAALQWQAREFEKRSGIKCSFVDNTNDMEMSYEVKSNLFRIFQESLTNIMRHANATKVEAQTNIKNNLFCLTIKDNGRGFSATTQSKTLGILGMRERTIVINGTFDITSNIGIGTTITIKIPI